MANPEHLAKLEEGVEAWNKWREENPDIREPDLREAILRGAYLTGAILSGANLSRAYLSGARCIGTGFNDVDLSTVKGLEKVHHLGPSSVGIDTLYAAKASKGKIPAEFLRGCGVPDVFIDYIPSLVGELQPVQFYSCFISYSQQDDDFAQRLNSRLRDEHLRVWFAPEDIRGGKKLHEQIDSAIRIHDKLLIVLSEYSLKSKWVMDELRRAWKAQQEQGKRKLFPVRLIEWNALKDWEFFHSVTVTDLAEEVLSYYIPDFSNWKDHDSFETEFGKLLDALKKDESTAEPERGE